MKLSTRTHGRQSVGIGCKEEIIRAARKGRGTLQVAELGLLDESIQVLGTPSRLALVAGWCRRRPSVPVMSRLPPQLPLSVPSVVTITARRSARAGMRRGEGTSV